MSERFLMEESHVAMSVKGFSDDLHHDHVVVDGLGSIFEEGTELVLVDCDFFMPGFDWDSDFE